MDDKKEIWVKLLETNNEYEISNYGRIRRVSSQKIMLIKSGACCVCFNGKHKSIPVVNTVAKYFLPLPDGCDVNSMKVVCINGIRADANVWNLMWVSKIPVINVNASAKKINHLENAKHKQRKTALVQLREDGEYVRRYINIDEVLETHPTWEMADILMCLTGHFETAYNYRWMYEVEYTRMKNFFEKSC